MAKVRATIFDKTYVAIDPRTVTYNATVELRTHAEMIKGLDKGRGFAWVYVTDIPVDGYAGQWSDMARKVAVELGECTQEQADAASFIMINVTAQYGSDGKATVLREFNPHTQRMVREQVL